MSTYGPIERVFIVRNARGLSKVNTEQFYPTSKPQPPFGKKKLFPAFCRLFGISSYIATEVHHVNASM